MKTPDHNIENSEISIKKKKIKAIKDFQNNLEEDAKMNKKRKKKRNDVWIIFEEGRKPEKKLKIEENRKAEPFAIHLQLSSNIELLNINPSDSDQQSVKIFKDFVQVLLHLTVISLKKDSKNVSKLDFLCKTLVDNINSLKQKDNFTFEELTKNYSWPQFTRINLKLSLKTTKENKKKSTFLLKALIAACNVAYRDNGNEEYVKTIFEMTTSHSDFINIMLSDSNEKSDLVELLWILMKKNHSVMMVTHIPLYLASYNATLSSSNQFILKILKHYENNGIKLNDYQPYLWGSTAATHYSVKGETDTALWRQPTMSQVLDLLVPEIVINTIKNFPVSRNLEGDFIKEASDQIYDPAFYLPVFSHLLSDNYVVACHKVIRSGALALTIIACSSNCSQVRLAAFTVISRFYNHVEATNSKEKLLWINFIDALRNGILKNNTTKLEHVQLNGFVATFLARTSLVMTQPLNPLYSALQAFLMAKPALDISTIPEFLQLFYSSEIEHKAHRHWILEVICDGLKLNSDMEVALRSVIFKMFFECYQSVLSDKQSKNLILQIIRSATKLLKPCLILANGHALLPWLFNVTEHITKGDIDSIICIVDIVNNITNALSTTKSKQDYYYEMLAKILVCLKTSFSESITEECLKTFIQVLLKVMKSSIICSIFTKNQLKDLLEFSKKLSKDLDECEVMLQFGSEFVQRKTTHADTDITLQQCLYQLILKWFDKNNDKNNG